MKLDLIQLKSVHWVDYKIGLKNKFEMHIDINMDIENKLDLP